MTTYDLIGLGCGALSLALPYVGYRLGKSDGYARGLAERAPCGHAPCPLVGVKAHVTMATAHAPEFAETRRVPTSSAPPSPPPAPAVPASGSWAEANPAAPRWPPDASTLPDLTRVPDSVRRKPPKP